MPYPGAVGAVARQHAKLSRPVDATLQDDKHDGLGFGLWPPLGRTIGDGMPPPSTPPPPAHMHARTQVLPLLVHNTSNSTRVIQVSQQWQCQQCLTTTLHPLDVPC
jgi:hypothetical protein